MKKLTRRPTMARDALIAALFEHGDGWRKIVDDAIALQDRIDPLIDEISATMTEAEWRKLGRKLNGTWSKHKHRYAFGLIVHAIKILKA